VKEILPEVERWRQEGEKIVVATVVATRRSAPRPLGASLAISESGKMCGSVSGGCVESDVFESAQEVFETLSVSFKRPGSIPNERYARKWQLRQEPGWLHCGRGGLMLFTPLV